MKLSFEIRFDVLMVVATLVVTGDSELARLWFYVLNAR